MPLSIAALALASLPACTASEEKVAAMATEAQQLLDAGKPWEAQELIRSALKKRDDMPGVYLVAAHVANALGKRGDAYQAYSNVLSLQATNPEALLGVAQTGLGSGHLEEADRAADKILVLDPNQTDAMLVKGIAKMVRHDMTGAGDYADHILALKPDSLAGVILKSRVLALQGDRAGALALVDGASKRLGDQLELTMSRAELERVGGDPQAFLAAVRHIREQMPHNREFRFDLIDVLYRLGRVDEARAEASSLLDEPIKDPEELAQFPRLWFAYDRPALTDQQVARVAKDGSVEARLMLARYLVAVGKAPSGAAVLKPLASGWSNDILGLYARAGEAMGQAETARQVADRVLAKDPDNGDALLIRAHAATARNDPKTAIVNLQQVVRDYPAWEEGYFGLVQAYLAANKPDQVRRVLEDGHRVLPQSLPYARFYVQTLLQLGNATRALDVARRFALDSPSLGAAWDLYAEVCAKAGDAECRAEVAEGATKAKTRYGLDQKPGTPPPVTLIGRLKS